MPKEPRIKVLREVHETPAWAEEYLTRVGGLNRFDEPNLRVVWGWNRIGWIGGKFEDRDDSGALIREVKTLRREPKYPVVNRWLIEQWIAPEKFGTPATWYRHTKEYGEEGNIPQLGPYPSRGDYQLSCVVQAMDGQFLQLTRDVLEDFWRQFRAKRELTYLAGLMLEKQALEKKKQKQKESDAEWAKEEMRSKLFIHDTRGKSVNQYL